MKSSVCSGASACHPFDSRRIWDRAFETARIELDDSHRHSFGHESCRMNSFRHRFPDAFRRYNQWQKYGHIVFQAGAFFLSALQSRDYLSFLAAPILGSDLSLILRAAGGRSRRAGIWRRGSDRCRGRTRGIPCGGRGRDGILRVRGRPGARALPLKAREAC